MIQPESSDSGYVKGYSNEFHPRVAVALAEAQGTKCSVLEKIPASIRLQS